MPLPAQSYQYSDNYQKQNSLTTNPYEKKCINAASFRGARSAVGTHKYAPEQPNFGFQVRPLNAPVARPKLKRVKVRKKTNPLQLMAQIAVAAFLGAVVLPYSFHHLTKTMLINPIKTKNIQVDYNYIVNPTLKYLHNEYFMNQPMRVSAQTKKPTMQPLFEADRMTMLETALYQLMQSYPLIQPSIYVWEYENGKYININADRTYPTASIIKIPVLIEMFRAIESGQFKLYDRMVMGEHYRTSGSGSLQFQPADKEYSMDTLARHMIEESDNTSTNMIMAKIGGKHSVNRALKNWGLKKTRIENWLPDLAGSNVSTAREMSTIIYNINNESLLNINSRENIIDYMSHVHNNRLIQAGLPAEAQFIHKTGDIGTMLGDAGIVYAPNGKRYIVTIFAKRPYNSQQGKDFIVQASKIIYDYVVNGKV